MKAHYLIEKDLLAGNGIIYLYVPDKNVVICLGALEGEPVIKNPLQGGFYTNSEKIQWAKDILKFSSKKKNKNREIGFDNELFFDEYGGKINLSKKQINEISGLLKEYESLRVEVEALNKKSSKIKKSLEKLVKKKYPSH